jgi:DNA-binding CsgD family transcriptional regulator
VVNCNLFRQAPNSAFAERERKALGRIVPILANLAAVQRTLCEPLLRREQSGRISSPEDEVQQLRQRLGRSPFDGLTKREQQVCFRILLGYSSEAIGFHLGVAENTIWTYRKRAYEKLGIVSQNELFSLYLHSLPGFRPGRT